MHIHTELPIPLALVKLMCGFPVFPQAGRLPMGRLLEHTPPDLLELGVFVQEDWYSGLLLPPCGLIGVD